MKKIVLLLASIGLMTAAQAAYKDGTYEGEGDGNHGKITVSVDVKGGKIANVKVLKHTETDMIIQAPIDNMIPEIVKKNGVDGVETVAGATNSSKGIQQAVKKALAKAQ
ncbi:FMN-binding protein [uncultured Parasutterella sp.]|uniref:FMN-binding protein n=1 Tax=uncultured Parasutterella sp. TaxID=1263098 RepID=UPI0025B5FAEC|nr:FMN-binding protein [uncultured Parasutterella sp.]